MVGIFRKYRETFFFFQMFAIASFCFTASFILMSIMHINNINMLIDFKLTPSAIFKFIYWVYETHFAKNN